MRLTHKNTAIHFFDKYGTVYHVVCNPAKKEDRIFEFYVNRKLVKEVKTTATLTATNAKRYLQKVLRELNLWK